MNRMAKVLLGSMLAIGLAWTFALAQHEGHGHGEHAADKTPDAKCPVSGEPINLAASLATDDGPVFFCCKDCIAKYQANPAKYAEAVAAQRKAMAGHPKVQVTCPVSGEPVDQEVSIESEGHKVHFCCKDCIAKYQKDPAKYAAALANSYTYQTKCPVMGEEIDPKVFATTANGTKVYFCCKRCDGKFHKDPQKYAASLSAQGFEIDPKEIVRAEDKHGADGHEEHDH